MPSKKKRSKPISLGLVLDCSIVMARAHQLSVYDAAYLELAVRHGLPLASLDGPLNAAAAAVGVPKFER